MKHVEMETPHSLGEHFLDISIISGTTADGCNTRESSESLLGCVQMVSFVANVCVTCVFSGAKKAQLHYDSSLRKKTPAS